MDLFGRSIDWPALCSERLLVLGLGGGSDAIAAYAIASLLGDSVAYANTKRELEADLIRISPRIAKLDDGAVVRGKTKIERRLPRGPLGSPLIVAVDDDGDALARELVALGFDCIVGVDLGGDSLDDSPHGNRGRDRQMVDVLRRTGLRATLLVLAPGADGQLSQARLDALLAAELEAGRYRGVLSLEPLLPALREHGRALVETRTPNIICRAFDLPADPVAVPRGCKPIVPRRWLTSGFAFELSAR
jgi:hypothetical protein